VVVAAATVIVVGLPMFVVCCHCGEVRVVGCSCGSCFLQVTCSAMYSMLCTKIIWPVGIVGKCAVGIGSIKLRV
jgi:hypothetical protein